MDDLDLCLAELKGLTVFGHDGIEAGLGRRTIDDGGSRSMAQVEMTAHEVGMEVCLKDVLESDTVTLEAFDIWSDLTKRVNDGGFAHGGDIVCTLSETACIDLFYFHNMFGFFCSVMMQR